METIQYLIHFHDFWCTASGLSGGARADILTLKDNNYLPYVPGRTLKGLFREAAEILSESSLTDPEVIKLLFGEKEWREGGPIEDKHRKRKEGLAFFSNATLNKKTVAALDVNIGLEMLYETIASTSINPNTGIAETHSLRRTEAALPCTLFAEIMIESPLNSAHSFEECKMQIGRCMKYIKRLGHHRTRGLGRCTFSIFEA